MFELPEYTVLARQINETLTGKEIQHGSLGNSPHKFVWYNRSHEEFERLTSGKVIRQAQVKGRWMSVTLEPGYILLFGECGGKILYHQAGEPLPKKYHLLVHCTDGTFLSATTQMWGAYELYERGLELEREYIKDMRPTPVDAGFTLEYFNDLIDEVSGKGKRSVKGLLTQDQLIPGLGNSIAQDIMFNAHLNPKRDIAELHPQQRQELFAAIRTTVEKVIQQGGRNDEVDLFCNPGGYIRIMDRNAPGKPCPRCSGEVVKIQYLGGACYFCQDCQN